jgi:hypothetical protein
MKNKLFILGSIFLTSIFTTFLFGGAVVAQPACEWDCSTICCSPGIEEPCNGGTYGGLCPDACTGPPHVEANICPF